MVITKWWLCWCNSGRVFWCSGCGVGDGFWKDGICDCCRSALVKSVLCSCGIGIGGVVVMVVIMG